MAVIILILWLGLSGLIAWATTIEMPDGYGNALFLTLLVAAFPSGHFVAHGLPSWIDPRTKVVVSGGPGRPNRFTTFSRKVGRKKTLIGIAVLVVALAFGWILEHAIGLPERHKRDVTKAAESLLAAPNPALDACLARVPTTQRESCRLTYRVSARGDRAALELTANGCIAPQLRACVQEHFSRGEVAVPARQLDSLAYAGGTTITIASPWLRGTAVTPAERPDP